MADTSSSLDKQIAEIEERLAEFVLPPDPAHLLSADTIRLLTDALIPAGLVTADARSDLLQGIHAGFVAYLHLADNMGDQVLSDLTTMNQVPILKDGQVPLQVWLTNAVSRLQRLGRVEATTFQNALDELAAARSRSEPIAAPTATVQPATVSPLSPDEIQSLQRQLADLRVRRDCPYRSLEPFYARHARFFFGRNELIKTLAAVTQSQPVVMVVGPSGSGKSSVVRAGLLPWLEQSGPQWRSVVFTPGPDPTDALARALVDLEGIKGLSQRQEQIQGLVALLDHDGATFRRTVADIAARYLGVSLLIVVDQFEGLYSPSVDVTVQRSFVDALVEATRGNNQTHVVLTVRADFYGHFAGSSSWAQGGWWVG